MPELVSLFIKPSKPGKFFVTLLQTCVYVCVYLPYVGVYTFLMCVCVYLPYVDVYTFLMWVCVYLPYVCVYTFLMCVIRLHLSACMFTSCLKITFIKSTDVDNSNRSCMYTFFLICIPSFYVQKELLTLKLF